jgi:tetratricopeptide (TPR) repeat protein
MKRAERHHLKDNELIQLVGSARDLLEKKRKLATILTAAVGVVLVAGIGYYVWRHRVETRSQALLAEALVVEEAPIIPAAAPGSPAPPGLSFPTVQARTQAAVTKLKAAADSYPSTDAAVFARYRLAGAYMALGEVKSAIEAYQQIIDRRGTSLYGKMARLGLAQAQAQTGATDEAIATYSTLAQEKDGPIPVDGVLLQLARTYLEAGNKGEAEKTFTRLVEEFPQSPFAAEAKQQLEQIKKA